jgi:predicted metalloendopeptidase
MALYLFQGGTALPDRDYYLKDDGKFAEIRAKYVEYLTKVFTLAGRPNAAEDARTVLGLETELAKIQWTQVESRDAVKTYNKYPVQKVIADMPGFDWMAWAAPQGIDKTSEWVISQPSFFKSFAAMVPKTPLATWKAWMAAQVITMNASYLSKPFDEARFEFFNKHCRVSSSSGSGGREACSSSTDRWAKRSASCTCRSSSRPRRRRGWRR